MVKVLATLGRISAVLLLMVSMATAADVTINLGDQSGAAGTPVDFQFSYNGPLNCVGVTFPIAYDAEAQAAFAPVFKAGSTTDIVCSVNIPPLPSQITVSGKVLPDKGIIGITFSGNTGSDLIPFGITQGILGSCQFQVSQSTTLRCGTNPAFLNSSDVDGNDLDTACAPGTLTVTGAGPTATATEVLPTATATATTAGVATATATATTAVATATATKTTAVATATPSSTSVPTATKTPVPVTLAAGISATDTTITLSGDLSAFPSSGTIQIDSETINYSSKSGNTLTVTRGAGAAAHNAGAKVTLVTAPAAAGFDEDGCQIGTRGGYSGAWLLLIPAVGLLVMRRRNR